MNTLTRQGQHFPRRLRVYVAGPYTRPDPVANTHHAVKVGEELQKLGYHPVVPHLSLLWHLIHPHTDTEFWYEYDLHDLAACDVLLRIAGASTGADREVEFALENGIPVVYNADDLCRLYPAVPR